MTRNKLIFVVTFWLFSIGGLAIAVVAYSVTPGAPTSVGDRWPDGASFEHASERHTVVLVAHPHCSCTRATLSELARILTRLGDSAEARVIVLRPDGFDAAWARTDIWDRAKEITGVEPLDDVGGIEAAKFGAHTSGATLLFSPAGERLFAGGLTSARGHEGPSVGRRRIVELVLEGRSDRPVSDVFGCSLDDDTPTWIAALIGSLS